MWISSRINDMAKQTQNLVMVEFGLSDCRQDGKKQLNFEDILDFAKKATGLFLNNII